MERTMLIPDKLLLNHCHNYVAGDGAMSCFIVSYTHCQMAKLQTFPFPDAYISHIVEGNLF